MAEGIPASIVQEAYERGAPLHRFEPEVEGTFLGVVWYTPMALGDDLTHPEEQFLSIEEIREAVTSASGDFAQAAADLSDLHL